ncbi:MAG: hypothetical protein ABI648_13290 [Betaproteobacteria bacterium]|jgi:hypothetical protein
MTSRTLFTAFTTAQTLNAAPRSPAAGPKLVCIDDTTLLAALRNAATDRDQIIQRRLGLHTDDEFQT